MRSYSRSLTPTSTSCSRRRTPTAQHDDLADAYRANGVQVVYVDPGHLPPPNQMFCADLFVMTPSGAIVGRPASTVRAGEERWIARRLADCGVPILRSVGGRGTFEGADLCWLAPGAPGSSLLSFGIIAAGVPAYYLWRRRTR